MNINEKCDGLKSVPLWVSFVSIFGLCHLTPLVYFYINWYSRYERGVGDIRIGNEYIFIPSISKTWRNFNSIFPVLTGAVIMVSVYSVCLVETGDILCLLLGVLLALFVFSFNDEDGPISKVHGVFAFGLFAYLLWLVSALHIYIKEGVVWWWPYIPMGMCIIGMIGYSIVYILEPKDKDGVPIKYKKKFPDDDIARKALSHWPSWVSICEHVFILSFEIYMLTVISKYEI